MSDCDSFNSMHFLVKILKEKAPPGDDANSQIIEIYKMQFIRKGNV